MRRTLPVLIAFAAGIVLMLALQHGGWHPATAVDAPAPAPATSVAVAGSAPDEVDGGVQPAVDQDDWPAGAPSPEQVMSAQPKRLHDALAALSPRIAGQPNVYVVAFAGDGAEDVFRNEAEYAGQLFPQRFGPSAHALILENHPDSLSTRPLATWTNLEGALDGLATRMHPDEDILMLYLTTHGGEDHSLLVDMDPLPLDQLDPEGLDAILKKHAWRWKVVVVNACYAGGFIPSLRGPGTLVITAARADRSSFGCGADSDITYFGKAWLVDGLAGTPDFIGAFHRASDEIALWERRDKLTPSEPQIDIGAGIAERLDAWRATIAPAQAPAFAPARPVRTDDGGGQAR
jgi:hypothetical protein